MIGSAIVASNNIGLEKSCDRDAWVAAIKFGVFVESDLDVGPAETLQHLVEFVAEFAFRINILQKSHDLAGQTDLNLSGVPDVAQSAELRGDSPGDE